MASGNLDRLVEARVVTSADALSGAERTVIEGLSEEEVSTLIGIRQKLSDAVVSPAASLADEDPELDLKPNVVL
ncbi:MAG TPA: aroma-sacti cluster domain-containing protein [Thermoanaerobaculia bacterium]|nr:aroma-sacti cluster domain-containing protein [Thermoanaerobaculia bacterium]